MMTLSEEQKQKIERNRLKAIEKRNSLTAQRKILLETTGICSVRQEREVLGDMQRIKGDLIKLAIKGDFDVIIHGCNCFCTMGAGIALTIKKVFPEAYQADLQTNKGDKEKLGNYTSATIHRNGHQITVINAYTQYHYRGPGNKADYNAIKVFLNARSKISVLKY